MIFYKSLQWLKQNTNQSLNFPKTPIAHPKGKLGVSIVKIWEKSDRIIQ